MRKYTSATRHGEIIIGYTIIGTAWIVVSTPLIWRFGHAFFPTILLRSVFLVISVLILYALLNRAFRLSESRRDYQALIHTMMEPVVMHTDNIICDINVPALRFLGADSMNEIIGRSICDFVDSDFHPITSDRTKHSTTLKSTELFEEKFITLSGETRDAEVIAVPAHYRGDPSTLVMFTDITDRKEKEAALRSSENRLRTLINAIPDQICFIDKDGRWTEANRALLTCVGLQDKDYCGKHTKELAELCHPQFKRDLLRYEDVNISDITTENRTMHEHHSPNGHTSIHEVTTVPIQDSKNSNLGLVIIGRDITNERRARKQLATREQQYRSLFENDNDMIVSVGKDGVIWEANPACVTTLGYAQDALIGKKYMDLIAPPFRDAALERLQRIMQGERQTLNVDLIHKSGRTIPVFEKKIPFKVNDEINGFFWLIKDITQEKIAEEVLVRSERLSAVGELAAGIAHEIRNPLTALLGFVQLMLASNHAERTHLSVMKDELEHIELIVNELLVLAKPSSSAMHRRNCVEMIQEVVDLMSPHAIMNSIFITQSVTLEQVYLYCDKNRIKQVLVNVIKNAVEAMPNGGNIEIQVSVKDGGMSSIRIRDNGPGIPDEVLQKVGEPFYTTKNKGTGLGLTVSRKIVESHNGTLRIHSNPGQGTEVEIEIPIAAL